MSDTSTAQHDFNERAIEGMAEKRLQRVVDAKKQDAQNQVDEDYRRPPTPRNFIEVTDQQNVRLLVAISAIALVETVANYGDLHGKLTLTGADSMRRELHVRETYRELLHLLAQA
jgi:hypothetical protein